MTKECTCLPGAKIIAKEIIDLYEHGEPEDIVENANFVSGMLLVVQEAGLANTFTEFGDILDSVSEKNIDKFRDASYKAARKIEKISC